MRPSDLLGKSINFYPQVARIVGGINPALMLSQLIYWTGRQHDPEGWIYKTHAEFETELAMTRREQDTARNALVEIGIIECEVRGRPPKIHYRVNRDRLDSYLAESAKSNLAEMAGEFGGKRQSRMAESAKTSTDPEITSKNTNKEGVLGDPFTVKPKYPAGKFEEFWNLYPKKTEKKDAQKAWLKVPAAEFPKLMARLKTFIAVDWAGKEKALIPNPATWLNGERWNDEVIPPAKFANGNGNGHRPPEPDSPLYHQPTRHREWEQ